MKNKKFLIRYRIRIAIGIMIFTWLMICLAVGILKQNTNMSKLNELQVRIDNFESHVVESTIETIMSEPWQLFQFIEISSEWEEIKAIPYSKCYRHLVGTSTIADYIICEAI